MTITSAASPEEPAQLVVPLMVTYDAAANAAYLRGLVPVEAGGVARTVSVEIDAEGAIVNLDLDAAGHLIGLEVLDAARPLDPDLLGGLSPANPDDVPPPLA